MKGSMPPWMGKESPKEEMAEGATKAPLKPFSKSAGRKAPKRGAKKMGRSSCR